MRDCSRDSCARSARVKRRSPSQPGYKVLTALTNLSQSVPAASSKSAQVSDSSEDAYRMAALMRAAPEIWARSASSLTSSMNSMSLSVAPSNLGALSVPRRGILKALVDMVAEDTDITGLVDICGAIGAGCNGTEGISRDNAGKRGRVWAECGSASKRVRGERAGKDITGSLSCGSSGVGARVGLLDAVSEVAVDGVSTKRSLLSVGKSNDPGKNGSFSSTVSLSSSSGVSGDCGVRRKGSSSEDWVCCLEGPG